MDEKLNDLLRRARLHPDVDLLSQASQMLVRAGLDPVEQYFLSGQLINNYENLKLAPAPSLLASHCLTALQALEENDAYLHINDLIKKYSTWNAWKKFCGIQFLHQMKEELPDYPDWLTYHDFENWVGFNTQPMGGYVDRNMPPVMSFSVYLHFIGGYRIEPYSYWHIVESLNNYLATKLNVYWPVCCGEKWQAGYIDTTDNVYLEFLSAEYPLDEEILFNMFAHSN